MSVLDRKLARELVSRAALLITIASIMSVGIACYVGMQSAYFNLRDAKERYFRQCRMADFWIDLKKAPVTELEALADLPGVTEIEPRIQFFATVDIEGVVEPVNGLVVSMPQQREAILNNLVMKRGDYFTGRRANEVIVNDKFAREHRLQTGQWIHLLLNNRRQEMFVVGTAISSEFTYMLGPGSIVPDPEHYGVFYISEPFAEEVFDFEGAANQVTGRLAPELREHPEDLLRRAEALLEPYGVFSTTPLELQSSNLFLSSEISQLAMLAKVLPAIFLTVAALVLNVLMSRIARQERTTIGTLKAIGYTDGQVLWYFLKFGLSIGLAGGIGGCVAGFGLAAVFTNIYRSIYEFPDLRNQYHISTWIIGLAVSLLCSVFGSAYGVWAMLRLQPAEAMRPEPPKRGGRILLERLGFFWGSLSSGWRLVLRSLFRQRVRSAAGMFAAMMGTCILVVGFMGRESTSYLIEFQFQQLARSDVDLTLSGDKSEQALDDIRRLPGVDRAEPTLNVACTLEHGPYQRKTSITGLVEGARLTLPRDSAGARIVVPEGGLLVSRRIANLLHLEPGDRVRITPVKGDRRTVEAPVVNIVDTYLGMVIYADLAYLSSLVDEPLIMNGAQLETDGDPQHRLELYEELKQMPGIESVVSRQEVIDNLLELVLETQTTMNFINIVFAGIIFFGSIINASLVNLAERQREVATFRALGYTPWQVGSLFLRESMLLNLVGTLCGLPLGYLLMATMVNNFQTDVIRIPLVTAPWIWIETFIFAIVFTLLAHLFVQRRIHKMDVVEALKAPE